MDDKLTALIYLLLREHITFGELEKLLSGMEGNVEFRLDCPDGLAEYVRGVAKRVLEE